MKKKKTRGQWGIFLRCVNKLKGLCIKIKTCFAALEQQKDKFIKKNNDFFCERADPWIDLQHLFGKKKQF